MVTDIPAPKPAKRSLPQVRVIPREQHGVSRKNISPNALRVLYKLKEGGFAAYLVGGAVRDLLLGGSPKDFDVATDATPEQVKQLFRNCRLIGRRFRLAHVVFGGEIIEVATFRALGDDGTGDREMVDGRIVRDNVYGTIEEDAVRRDFTANALYYAIEDFSVRDYADGFEDIRHRTLRLIGDPEQRYREDPVRMLRAVRLAAKLGFRIDDAAWMAIAELAPLIGEAAPARLFDEMLKLFLGGHAYESLRWLEASGLLRELLPATAAAIEEHGGEEMPRMMEAALKSTDLRLTEGRSVTPAFLLAVLLWPAARVAHAAEVARGTEPLLAWSRASDHVVRTQAARIAVPRRYTLPIEEIWTLQTRLEQSMRKRTSRLLAHPRFRAAYDFLCVRALDEPSLKELADFWTRAQVGTAQEVAPDAASVDDVAEPAPKTRRRRRRRPGAPAAAPDGA
jgi:poly(A) polymerase